MRIMALPRSTSIPERKAMSHKLSQETILTVIRSHIEMHGIPPTRRELAALLDSSPSSIQMAVDRAVLSGRLRKVPRRARGLICVTE